MQNGLTVGMPVYNEGRFIQETLEALMKDYDVINEIIISDNMSTDETAAICQTYVEDYPKITYIQQEAHISAADNYLFLLNRAKTTYFMWLAGHDILGDNYCRSILQALNANPNAVAAMPMVYGFDDKTREKKLRYDVSKSEMESEDVLERVSEVLDHWETCYIVNQVFKRDVLKKISIEIRPEYINWDHILAMHAALLGRVLCVPNVGYDYRAFRGNESKQEIRARYRKQFKVEIPYINPNGYIPREYWRLCKKYIPDKCDEYLKRKVVITCESFFDADFDNKTWLKRHILGKILGFGHKCITQLAHRKKHG